MSNKKPGASVGHKYKLGKTLKSCFKTAVLFFPPDVKIHLPTGVQCAETLSKPLVG